MDGWRAIAARRLTSLGGRPRRTSLMRDCHRVGTRNRHLQTSTERALLHRPVAKTPARHRQRVWRRAEGVKQEFSRVLRHHPCPTGAGGPRTYARPAHCGHRVCPVVVTRPASLAAQNRPRVTSRPSVDSRARRGALKRAEYSCVAVD